MAKPTEGTAQRRKLLGQIERLAEIAVFGTLSGNLPHLVAAKVAIVRGDGPKHGPHLNCELPPARRARTTGYYVPKGAEEATREGVAAWAKPCSKSLPANWQS